MKPTDLPVYKQKAKVLEALEQSPVVVVESPTGSGKTTQIPQILYDAGYFKTGIIGVTQPRRIAAVSVTEFIARQMGKEIPDTVGYKMRFEDKTDASTRIKVMTDGILLQEIKTDHLLSPYSVIMVDEAHERSLNIDFILGLLKRVLRERPEFKVIVSSATINAEVFSEYFDECPIVKIEAGYYPINLFYEPPKLDSYESMLEKICQLVSWVVRKKNSGDILIFLSGERPIKDCLYQLSQLSPSSRMKLLPLYARLSSSEQEKVFLEYPGKTKVIVATNIAETSVTIDGIKVVIDTGLAKINSYNQKTFTSSLDERPISRASCNQRRGRAGRTAPGSCFRLYTRASYESRSLFTQEEIYRTDLSEVVLRMAEIGIKEFQSFDFLSPPGRAGIASAIETLKLLDALDGERNLTEVGGMMLRFPLLPKHSRMIIEAIHSYPSVLAEVVTAACFLTTRSPFLLPMGRELEARKAHHTFRDPFGDFVSYLKLLKAYLNSNDGARFCERYFLDPEVLREIVNIRGQLEEIVSDMGIPILSGGELSDYLCAVSRGLIQFVCVRSGRNLYRSLKAKRISIHPGSVMFAENPQYIVAGEIVRTTRMYARSVSRLKLQWLRRISSLLYESLVGGAALPGEIGGRRDTTNQIKIGNRIYKIVNEKGKKTVILPWDRLKATMRDIDPYQLRSFKDLRGKILFQDHEIFSGARLRSILSVAGKLNFEGGIIRKWPRGALIYPDSTEQLSRFTDHLLRLCRDRKNSKELGFLALYSEGEGLYRYRCKKKFHTALSESLSALEDLADRIEPAEGEAMGKKISSAYRRLSMLMES
jgi:RNA helicase HrpA